MAAIGIITCQILELEFAHLLMHDRQVAAVTVVDTPAAQPFITTLEAANRCRVYRVAHHSSLRPEPRDDLHAVVQVLDYRLHRNRQNQLRIIKDAAMALRRHIECLVLGYGMCGGLLTEEAFNEHLDIPVFRPQENGRLADDCVGMMIGGRQRYYAEQCNTAGTFFMTPGWTNHWREMLMGNIGQQTFKRLFSNYSRALIIETPVLDRGSMLQNVRPFTSMLHLKCEVTDGTMSIMKNMWHTAKASMTMAASAARKKIEVPYGSDDN